MDYHIGQVVRHPTLGLGKILQVLGPRVKVFFKDAVKDQVKVILPEVIPLQIADDEHDSWLENLDPSISTDGAAAGYLTQHAAVQKFLSFFPQGFYDPTYIGDKKVGERQYKVLAHELWVATLGQDEYRRLLEEGAYKEVASRALKVEAQVNLLSIYEKGAIRDAVKEPEPARAFAVGLFDLVYGADPFEQRFNRFGAMLGKLPQPKSRTHTWPIQTLFPFLACPTEHLFLKPDVVKKAAARRAFSLCYDATPNWTTYSALLKLAKLLMQDLAELKPRDMIDIQSFIWVTGDDTWHYAKQAKVADPVSPPVDGSGG